MSEIDFEALAAELPASEDATNTAADETPESATPPATETGDTTEAEGAGDDAGAKDEAEPKPEPEDEDKPERRRLSGSARLRAQNEALRAELEALRSAPARRDGSEGLQKAIEAEIGAKPKEADFNGDFMAFERAVTRWEIQHDMVSREIRREQAQRETRAETASREHLEGLLEDHNERCRALEKALPGSAAIIQAAKDAVVHPHVIPLILNSEKSALVQRHLAENPETLAALNRLSPVDAARRLGQLEARLSLPKPKTATAAPPPVRAVRGAAAPPSHDQDLSAWLAKKYGG